MIDSEEIRRVMLTSIMLAVVLLESAFVSKTQSQFDTIASTQRLVQFVLANVGTLAKHFGFLRLRVFQRNAHGNGHQAYCIEKRKKKQSTNAKTTT